MKITSVLTPALFVLAICACDRTATPETSTATDAPAPAMEGPVAGTVPATSPVEAPAGEAKPAPPAFVDKVWRVRESSAVAVGTRYSFLGDGTLVIEGAGGPPGYGSWAYADGALTMNEEGIAYPVDILALDADRFEIRSNNPGEPVTIALEAVANAPLPASPPK